MCNIFESPLTLAVAKPPHHSPTCRPPPSRDTPHTHWTLLQRDLPIEHQRTYQPYSGYSAPHPYRLLSLWSRSPSTRAAVATICLVSRTLSVRPTQPAAHHPLQRQTRLLQLAQHRLHRHYSSASGSSFLARFLRTLHQKFPVIPVLCLPLCPGKSVSRCQH